MRRALLEAPKLKLKEKHVEIRSHGQLVVWPAAFHADDTPTAHDRCIPTHGLARMLSVCRMVVDPGSLLWTLF